ncbi:hypothetical protein [Mycobacterium sp. NAZ190054]|uniref:hypothetical protein n=1 Tax=Mycobacterium sp. NAZ190054 TaxID=1747766 RepID=UPI0007962BCD|nr:hypothetical protein [Mycobacterium sp. NAZ190054]KWX64517.1 hypothetical protein ASJ79_08085 [Mycobacterium sp. NAZ190054]
MSPLTEAQRAVLLDAADILVPATDTMPALRAADPAGEWLGRACRARADLVGDLAAILDGLTAVDDLENALRAMHSQERARFDVVATFVAGTYYLIPQIRELVGYPGQVRAPAPIDLAADELSDEIFEGAMNYSGSYRPAPA